MRCGNIEGDMNYGLRAGISFCLTGERAIVLDVRRDRYFGLSPARTRLLLSNAADLNMDVLVDDGVVELGAGHHRPRMPCSSSPVVRDVVREADDRPRALDLAAVTAAVIGAQMTLKLGSLETALNRLTRRKNRISKRYPVSKADHGQAEALARRFNATRPLVPIASVCLLDSLAIAMFLAAHGIVVDVVFGVDAPPFSAHAWAQSGDCVLNDEVDRVAIYKPILVV